MSNYTEFRDRVTSEINAGFWNYGSIEPTSEGQTITLSKDLSASGIGEGDKEEIVSVLNGNIITECHHTFGSVTTSSQQGRAHHLNGDVLLTIKLIAKS